MGVLSEWFISDILQHSTWKFSSIIKSQIYVMLEERGREEEKFNFIWFDSMIMQIVFDWRRREGRRICREIGVVNYGNRWRKMCQNYLVFHPTDLHWVNFFFARSSVVRWFFMFVSRFIQIANIHSFYSIRKSWLVCRHKFNDFLKFKINFYTVRVTVEYLQFAKCTRFCLTQWKS